MLFHNFPHFEWPWALGALLLLPLLAWRRRRLNPPTLVFNRTAVLPHSPRQKFLQLPAALRLAALALLIVAVARPQLGARPVRDISKSIAIQVLIDRSSSMRHTDFQYGRGAATRLDVVKTLSLQFIFGNQRDLKGRPSDMIGLIEFAGDPITLSPLTLSHDHLSSLIESIQPARGDEDGTAIGDAVALAAARFKEAETAAGGQLKSKVIVLLTDGQNNMGARTPAQAAALAKQWGVRVYAIGIQPGVADSRYDRMIETGLDELGEETGGLSRMVESGAALVDVYKEIDRLEPAEVKAARYTGGTAWFGALALAALCLVAAEAAISQTWLRRAP
jgi:Ca-activated chloride channel family protein